jgi:hypothetical protein
MKKIACIGWGSLIWKPESLPLAGEWREGGPALPVEFARQSENKRITLVICPNRSRVPTRWAELDVPDVITARRALGLREWDRAPKNPRWIEENIGFWEQETGASHGMEAAAIAAWAGTKRLDGVVWTNLPAKFNGVIGTLPTADEVVESLRSLDGKRRDLAEEYVRRAPRELDTAYRKRIEQEFGWSCA